MSGNVSILNISLGDLVRDPRLQCRATIDEDVVAEYAEAMQSGAVLPPIKAVRDTLGGRFLVVDGWHRLGAHELLAESEPGRQAAVEVTEGDFRLALQMAVRANGDHGLRRTHDDKRRAVRVLLQDEEWCGLSTRDLGQMARVSHAFVGQVRKHYGVKKGEVLTEDRIEEVDGDLPQRWKELIKYSWQEPLVRAVRCARDISALRRATKSHSVPEEATRMRLEELGDGVPWPWEEDTTLTARRNRAKGLDTVKDLRKALASGACPSPLKHWRVLAAAERMARAKYQYDLPGDPSLFKGRPALEARLTEKKRTLGGASVDRAIYGRLDAAGDDEQARVSVIESATEGDIAQLSRASWALRSDLEREALAKRAAELGRTVSDCADPRCGRTGVIEQQRSGDSVCIFCRQYQSGIANSIATTLEKAGALLDAGLVVRSHGARVRSMDLQLLAAIQAEPDLVARLATLSEQEVFTEWTPPEPLPDPAERRDEGAEVAA